MAAEQKNDERCQFISQYTSLEYLKFEKILGRALDNRGFQVLASVPGHEGKAVILIAKKPFECSEEAAMKLICEKTKVTLDKQNDIYYQYFAYPEKELNSVKVEVIFPATEKHIQKYSQQKFSLVRESPSDYDNITKPYIDGLSTKSVEWVYNILDHKKESETLIVEDLDEKNGFAIVPDFKWDQKDINSLYCLAIVRRRDVKSLRDLTSEHIPLLKNVLNKGLTGICEKYNILARDLRVYFHYQPSFYHLHVHFVAMTYFPPGMNIGRAHLLEDVVQNLEMDSDYYKKASITFQVGSAFPLYDLFFNKQA